MGNYSITVHNNCAVNFIIIITAYILVRPTAQRPTRVDWQLQTQH